jgi:uncharacterized DUF497 family protein
MRFEWDESKAARNLVKHGVSFEEAVFSTTHFQIPLMIQTIPQKSVASLSLASRKRPER